MSYETTHWLFYFHASIFGLNYQLEILGINSPFGNLIIRVCYMLGRRSCVKNAYQYMPSTPKNRVTVSCYRPTICVPPPLTHWGRVTHICVGNLTIIGSDNGLSPGRRQAITWTNVGILLIGPLGTNFSEMLIEIHTFSFKKIHLKMSSGKKAAILSRPQCVYPPLASGHHASLSLYVIMPDLLVPLSCLMDL